MEYSKIDTTLVLIEKLREDHAQLSNSFVSESSVENDFLKKDALSHQRMKLSETYVLLNKNLDKILSYITLTIGSVKLSPEREFYGIRIHDKPVGLPNSIPCMLIGRLATDKNEEKKGYATYLIAFATNEAIEKSKVLPFPILALHAYSDKIAFYQKQGFKPAFTPSKTAETTCLYLPLFDKTN